MQRPRAQAASPTPDAEPRPKARRNRLPDEGVRLPPDGDYVAPIVDGQPEPIVFSHLSALRAEYGRSKRVQVRVVTIASRIMP